MPTRPIRQVIHGRKLVSAPPAMTVREAARLMASEKVGALPVVESGRLIGIFTERGGVAGVISARDALGPEITQFEAELQQRDDLSEKL